MCFCMTIVRKEAFVQVGYLKQHWIHWALMNPYPPYLIRKMTLLIDLAWSERVQYQTIPQKMVLLIHTTWNNIWLLSGGELSVLYNVRIHVNSCVEINVIWWKLSNTKNWVFRNSVLWIIGSNVILK